MLTGKVAAVVDPTTLVLNLGHQDGVRPDMVFAIVSTHHEVRDPDSGEVLGQWEMVKARVVVTHVQERICTVRSLPQVGETPPGTLSAMMVQHSLGHYGQRAEERERLAVRAGDLGGRPRSQPVAPGDLARLVVSGGDVQEPIPSGGGDAGGR
jgi:hypothetical protein